MFGRRSALFFRADIDEFFFGSRSGSIGRLAVRWAGPRDARRQIESQNLGVNTGPISDSATVTYR